VAAARATRARDRPDETTAPGIRLITTTNAAFMKKHLGILARAAVSVGILAYILDSIFKKESPEHPWTEGAAKLWDILCSLDPLWFAGAVFLFGVICFVNIIRWQIILRVQHIDLTLWRATELFFIGHFFNSFMLGATGGDVVKAYYAAQETHHKKAEAVMTVIIDRLVGLVGMFTVASLMMLLNIRLLFHNDQLRPMAVTVLGVLAFLIFCLFIGFWPGLGKFLHHWRERLFHGTAFVRGLEAAVGSARLERWRARFAGIRNSIKKMIGAYQAYASHKPALVKTFLLSLVTHISLIFSVLCLGESLHIVVNQQFYFLMVPAIMCIAAIPITISGLGLREALFVAAFAVGGVSQDKSLLLSLLTFATMLIYSIAGGVIYLFFERTHPSMQEMEAQAD
jgi:hypothetical protein